MPVPSLGQGMYLGEPGPIPDQQMTGLIPGSLSMPTQENMAWDGGTPLPAPAPTALSNSALAYGTQLSHPTNSLSTGVRPAYSLGYVPSSQALPTGAAWPSENGNYPTTAQSLDYSYESASETSRASVPQDASYYRDEADRMAPRAYSAPLAVPDASKGHTVAPPIRSSLLQKRSRSPSPLSAQSARWNRWDSPQAPDSSRRRGSSTQSKSRPFVCSYCSRAFARKHDLERHARVHVRCACCLTAVGRSSLCVRDVQERVSA